LWRNASPFAAPKAIIILVAHDKGTVASERIKKGHIHKLKNTREQKSDLNLVLQLIMNKKSEHVIVHDDLSSYKVNEIYRSRSVTTFPGYCIISVLHSVA